LVKHLTQKNIALPSLKNLLQKQYVRSKLANKIVFAIVPARFGQCGDATMSCEIGS